MIGLCRQRPPMTGRDGIIVPEQVYALVYDPKMPAFSRKTPKTNLANWLIQSLTRDYVVMVEILGTAAKI